MSTTTKRKRATEGTSVSSQLREILTSEPALMAAGNDAILARWAEKTGGTITDSTRGVLNNVKSQMRKQGGVPARRSNGATNGSRQRTAPATPRATGNSILGALMVNIDAGLMLADTLGVPGVSEGLSRAREKAMAIQG
jgi:hypothetical protein